MIYSYAACMSGRHPSNLLPLLLIGFRLDFSLAYPIVAWLAWIPNLMVAHVIVSKIR